MLLAARLRATRRIQRTATRHSTQGGLGRRRGGSDGGDLVARPGWSRSRTDEDEMTKIQFRKLWGWAREEFEAAVGRQQCGNDHEKMKVRKEIACAFYHSVYDPAIEQHAGAWADGQGDQTAQLRVGGARGAPPMQQQALACAECPSSAGAAHRAAASHRDVRPAAPRAPAGVAIAQDDADAGGMGLQALRRRDAGGVRPSISRRKSRCGAARSAE